MSTFTIFLVLIVLVAFLLVVVIMVQNPKGGGLSSSFGGGGGGQQLGGVKKTTDFLDKSTWALATILLVLILLSNITIPGINGNAKESKALDIDETTTSQPTPNNGINDTDTTTIKDSIK